MNPVPQNHKTEISISIGVIVFVIALLCVAMGKKFGAIDNPTALSAANILMGLILAVFGNFFPKFARPISAHLETSARHLAADRWSGRVMVFAGLVYAAMWLLAPFSSDTLKLIGPAFVLIVLLLVFANQMFIARTEIVPFQTGRPKSAGELSRSGAYVILHALAWAFAMMLSDLIWGDKSAIWMIVAFTIVNGLLMTLVLRRSLTNHSPQSED